MGETWTWSYTYTVQPTDPDPLINTAIATGTDPEGNTITAQASYSLDVLHPPVANDDAYSTDEDIPLTVKAPGVLSNDADPDNDSLSVVALAWDTDGDGLPNTVPVGTTANLYDGTGTLAGQLSIGTEGALTFSPAPDYNGAIEGITYTVSDGHGGTDTASIAITVNPVNDAPVAVDDAATTDEDTPVTIDVVANDYDVDGTVVPSTVTVVSGPAYGSVTNNGDGSITYSPNPNYFGADSFTYTVQDDDGATSNVATVTVTVLLVNEPPVAEDGSYTTAKGTPIPVRLVASDPNLLYASPEEHPLVFDIVGAPANGMVSGDLSAVTYVEPNIAYVELLYTPDPDFVGTDRFTFVVHDPYDEFDLGTITITVEEIQIAAGGAAGGAAAAVRPVAISEVAWGGTPANPEHEWIELVNLTDQPIDLTGWTLRWHKKNPDSAEATTWQVLELNGTIEPYGYFVLERLTPNAVADIPERNKADLTYGTGNPHSLRLSDEGEVIELVDPAGVVVDTANADPRRTSGWAAGYGINGAPPYATMERIDPTGPDVDENWTANAAIVVNGLDPEGDFLEGTARMQNEDTWLFSPLTANPWLVERGRILTFRFPAPDEGIEPWIMLVKVVENASKYDWPRFGNFDVAEVRPGIYQCRIYTDQLPPGTYQFWVSLSRFRVYGMSFEVMEGE